MTHKDWVNVIVRQLVSMKHEAKSLLQLKLSSAFWGKFYHQKKKKKEKKWHTQKQSYKSKQTFPLVFWSCRVTDLLIMQQTVFSWFVWVKKWILEWELLTWIIIFSSSRCTNNEAKISGTRALPSGSRDVILRQSLHSSNTEFLPIRPSPQSSADLNHLSANKTNPIKKTNTWKYITVIRTTWNNRNRLEEKFIFPQDGLTSRWLQKMLWLHVRGAFPVVRLNIVSEVRM